MKTKSVLSLLSVLLPLAAAQAASYSTSTGDGSFRRINATGGKLTAVDLSGSTVLQNGIQISLAKLAQQAATISQSTVTDLGQANGAAQLDANATLTGNFVTYNGTNITLGALASLAANALPSAKLGIANGVAQLDANASLNSGIVAASWTSAAQRTLAQHFGDDINVKDFGAVGDGTSDSTAAFLAAIRIATSIDLGATVTVPQGHYIVRQTLVATLTGDAGLHIKGAGIGETMIEFQIPASNASQDGIDLVSTPNTCTPSCYNWNSPWRGGGLSGSGQGQSSTIEELTLKTTGGPGYPAGTMISATAQYAQATEGQLPWLTLRNIDGMGAGPTSSPIWLNGIKLVGVQNVIVKNIYIDGHSLRSSGETGTMNGGGYIAGAGLLIEASASSSTSSYFNQTEGVAADTIDVSGYEASVALGGEAQGNGVTNLNCASSGGDDYCVVLGGGLIFDQDAGADFAVSGFANGQDYRIWVSSTSGIKPGMQIVPVNSSGDQGEMPEGAVVDQVGTTATNGFYPVSWTSPLEATTAAIASDTCTFTPTSGSATSQTCSAATNSDVLTVGSTSGLATGEIVADKTNPADFPTTMQVWAILSSTTIEVRASPNVIGDETPYTAGSATAPVQFRFAPAGAFIPNVPYGTGGFTVSGFDCGGAGACLYAPASPFDAESGYPQISFGNGEIESTASPQIVIGGGTNDNIDNINWNNGSGVFAQISNVAGVNVYQNVIDGNTTGTPAIQLTNVTGAEVYDNFVYGSSPLGTDTSSTDLWGLNYYNGAAHLGLAGTTLGLDSALSGCIETNGGAQWQCAVSGTVPAAASALLTPMGALPMPGTTTASAAAPAAATTLTVASGTPFVAGMTVKDMASGATATVQSVSGATLTLYAPGLTTAVASADAIANGYPAMGTVGGGIVPADGSLWAQGACNDSTLGNRSMISLGQQYDGTGSSLGANGNGFIAVNASTTNGGLFSGLALNTYPSGLTVPVIEVTNSNASGGASISCGFSVNLVKAP